MELTFGECKKILDILPLGYYCGRKIAVELDKEEATSFYSPAEDKIVVSLPIIQKGLESIANEAEKETAIRSMLYHEVSHAILTPVRIFDYIGSEEGKYVFNVFEDERIETVLNDYYMDVNFKQQLFNIVGETPNVDVNDPRNVFYSVVRYRYGKKEWTDMVAELIRQYSQINRNSDADWCKPREQRIDSYYYDIIDLWKQIKKDIADKSTPNDESNFEQAEQDLSDLLPNVEKGKATPVPNDKAETTNKSSKEDSGESAETEENADAEIGESARNDLKNQISKILNNKCSNSPKMTSRLNQFQKTLEMLIANFHKKNSNGNGYGAYSGVFNPRSVGREDYKYFDRKASVNGNNKYGTCHLNLVIDNSGSFYYNESIVNGILAILSDVERRNPDFYLDVSFIGEQMTTCQNVRERSIKCGGGNTIPEDFTARMTKLQKTNSYNYNIVLFDGDALSDAWSCNFKKKCKLFHQIDQSQTCLITDSENSNYIDSYRFTKAKVIVTEDYTGKLIENIERAFAIMFN